MRLNPVSCLLGSANLPNGPSAAQRLCAFQSWSVHESRTCKSMNVFTGFDSHFSAHHCHREHKGYNARTLPSLYKKRLQGEKARERGLPAEDESSSPPRLNLGYDVVKLTNFIHKNRCSKPATVSCSSATQVRRAPVGTGSHAPLHLPSHKPHARTLLAVFARTGLFQYYKVFNKATHLPRYIFVLCPISSAYRLITEYVHLVCRCSGVSPLS